MRAHDHGNLSLAAVSIGKLQLVFASAEDALDKAFLNVLKLHSNNFHKKLSALHHCRRIAQIRNMNRETLTVS